MQIAVRFYDKTFEALVVPLNVKRSALTKEDLKLLNENGYDAAERKRIDVKAFLVTKVPECVETNLRHIIGKRLFLYWNGNEKCWKHLDPDGDMLKANAKLYKTAGNVSEKRMNECAVLLNSSELLNGCEHPESISEKNKKEDFWDWVKRVHGIDMLAISKEYADYLNS